MSRRNRDGSTVRYLQLAHNERDPERGYAQAKVLYSFGREDEIDRDALARLVRSISRFLEPDVALEAKASEDLRFVGSRPVGGAYVLDRLWRALGIDRAIGAVAAQRRVSASAERVLFALAANRALQPSSKLAAIEWAGNDVALPGVTDLGSDPQVFYRAMDFLLDAEEEIQKEVFFSVANLLNLEVDLILFDTTSTYFEIEDEDDFRRYGHSKDHRDDRPQAVVGMAVTKEGIPVRCWVWPGNASDQVVIREVKDDLREWKLHRVVWVVDRGFTSEENRAYLQRAGGHYICGEKLRAGKDNDVALARAGRYAVVDDGLEVKEVWVGEGEKRRRFVVCRNLDEATRDKAKRDKALARLQEELAALATKKNGEAKVRAEAELITHPTLKRYLVRRSGRLAIDRAKVKAEARIDGKFLLSSSDDSLTSAEIALYYKQLKEVERAWRDEKHVLDLRPVYHRKEERIRSHVLLCWLGLLLMRVAETKAKDTWRNLRRELQRVQLGEFAGRAGRVLERSELTPGQREIFRALEIKEPPRFFELKPPARA